LPQFAHIAAEVPCLQCGQDVTIGGRVAIQWGYCSIPMYGSGPAYRVGDVVRWRSDREGEVQPWVYFADGTGNLGDPAFADLFVRESEHDIRHCRSCGSDFLGIGVVIRGGVICEVRAYDGGLPAAEVSIYREGELHPRPEWDDHPMRYATHPRR
jgi:hypothetical protein